MGAKAIVSQVSPLRPGLCPTHPLPRPAQTTRPIPAFAVAFRRERGASAPRMSPQKERALARGICSCRRLFFPYPLPPLLIFLSSPSTLQNPPNQLHTNHLKLKNSWHSSFPPTRIIKSWGDMRAAIHPGQVGTVSSKSEIKPGASILF